MCYKKLKLSYIFEIKEIFIQVDLHYSDGGSKF